MASLADDFNRSDDADSLGANWTQDTGEYNISSNAAVDVSAGSGVARYTGTALDSSNHFVAAPFSAGETGGVSARHASSTLTFYALKEGSYWSRKLVKVVAGSETTLDEYASGADSGEMKLIVDGATQEGLWNTVSLVSDTDSDISAGTYGGLYAAWYTEFIVNNWSAEDLAAGGSSVPIFFHHFQQAGAI